MLSEARARMGRRGTLWRRSAGSAMGVLQHRHPVDTQSHMNPEPPPDPSLSVHAGRRPHAHDDELSAPHAHAHADVWLSDVSAGYGDRVALEHVTIAVEPGSLLAVVGPNGAGKSTLLKLMAGLAPALDGTDRDPRRARPAARPPGGLRPAGRAGGLGVPGHGRGRRDDGPLPAPRADPPTGTATTGAPCRRARAGPDGSATCGRRSASSRAGSGGACSSPGRSPRSRTCSSSTSRSRASTPRPRSS